MTPDDPISSSNGLREFFLATADAASKAPDVMTLTEVASYTFRSVRTIRRWIERGTFPEADVFDGEVQRWSREIVDGYVCRGCKRRLPHE